MKDKRISVRLSKEDYDYVKSRLGFEPLNHGKISIYFRRLLFKEKNGMKGGRV